MEHVTACYWQKETPAELFLSLQQRKYRRLGISVVCACISDNGGTGKKSAKQNGGGTGRRECLEAVSGRNIAGEMDGHYKAAKAG